MFLWITPRMDIGVSGLTDRVMIALFLLATVVMLWADNELRAQLSKVSAARDEQVRLQDELRRERERLRLALEAGALAVWDYDPRTGAAEVDARYATSMGYGPDTNILSQMEIGSQIHPEDRPRVAAEHNAHVANGTAYHIEYRTMTPSYEARWVVSQGITVQGDATGRMVGIIQDITDRKRREEALRELAEARELLVREADHRIKNSLQMVIALLSVQLRGVKDPPAVAALREAIARVSAIAASHLALQSSDDLRTLDVTVTLREVCAHFAQLQPAIKMTCRPEHPLPLDADRAIPLGLVVSEVLTNAMRHAFVGRDAGNITVDAMVEEGELTVSISDDGVGMAPRAGGGGLGSRIIRSLAAQLAARIDVESETGAGTVVKVRLALAPEPLGLRAVG